MRDGGERRGGDGDETLDSDGNVIQWYSGIFCSSGSGSSGGCGVVVGVMVAVGVGVWV